MNPADRVLDKAGTVTLDVTDVRMKPVRLALTVGKHESLRKEITLKPELMHLPVELQLTVKGRRLNRELPAAIRRTILEKFKHVVACRRTHRRCFRLEVEVSARALGNPKMSQVHQIRGAIQVNLQSPFQRPAYTVEKELVGLGSSTRPHRATSIGAFYSNLKRFSRMSGMFSSLKRLITANTECQWTVVDTIGFDKRRVPDMAWRFVSHSKTIQRVCSVCLCTNQR